MSPDRNVSKGKGIDGIDGIGLINNLKLANGTNQPADARVISATKGKEAIN